MIDITETQLFLKNPVADVLVRLKNKPTLIAMIVEKEEVKTSPFGPITKRSLVVGQLIFDTSIALDMETKAKHNEALASDTVQPMKTAKAPWYGRTQNLDGKNSPILFNLKEPSKFYVNLDQMKGPEKATYYNKDGEQLTKEQVEPFLKPPSGGELAPVNFRYYTASNVKVFALAPAPEAYDTATYEVELIKLAKALEATA